MVNLLFVQKTHRESLVLLFLFLLSKRKCKNFVGLAGPSKAGLAGLGWVLVLLALVVAIAGFLGGLSKTL